jgi:RNA polymerase-binding transcription factor DksA
MVTMVGEKKTKSPKVAGKTASKTTSRVAGKVATNAPGKAPKAPGKTPSKTTSKTPGKTPGKTTSKTPVKTTVKASSRPPIVAAGKAASREKTPVKPTRVPEKVVTMSKAEWDAFIVKMDQLLQDEKSEIINTLVANNNEFKEIVDGMDPKDLADIASDDIDRRMIEMLGSQELKRLKLIESAQTRIKQGKYGHCIKCDRPIPPERLEAIPYALMCIDCKSEEERRNR